MITFNLKTSFSLLLLGIVIGFCSSFLFQGCGSNNSVTHEKTVQPKDLKKQAETNEASYQAKITELENKNRQLQQELKTTKEQLTQIKSKTNQRANNIKKIIEPKGYPAKELLKKVNSPSIAIDSSLSPCDSLVKEVSEYMQENILKDSLFESQIAIQDSVIAVKDSVIAFKTDLHGGLQSLFNQSLAQQETLSKENIQLRKQFKRQKLRSKLVAIGVTVLSALTAKYLISQ